jgi:hypothetical protein
MDYWEKIFRWILAPASPQAMTRLAHAPVIDTLQSPPVGVGRPSEASVLRTRKMSVHLFSTRGLQRVYDCRYGTDYLSVP